MRFKVKHLRKDITVTTMKSEYALYMAVFYQCEFSDFGNYIMVILKMPLFLGNNTLKYLVVKVHKVSNLLSNSFPKIHIIYKYKQKETRICGE